MAYLIAAGLTDCEFQSIEFIEEVKEDAEKDPSAQRPIIEKSVLVKLDRLFRGSSVCRSFQPTLHNIISVEDMKNMFIHGELMKYFDDMEVMSKNGPKIIALKQPIKCNNCMIATKVESVPQCCLEQADLGHRADYILSA